MTTVISDKANVEVTGAARFYRAASVWTAGLGNAAITGCNWNFSDVAA